MSLTFPLKLSNNAWLELVKRSVTNPTLGLPRFPPKSLQAQWVGNSDEDSVQEAFSLYNFISQHRSIDGEILDFGVGWGRIMRLFLNDVSPDHIYGVDTNSFILDECRRLDVPGTLLPISERSTLPFDENKFQIVSAYSVFTHISQRNADHWAAEINRVLQPGGFFALTLISGVILRMCIDATEPTAAPWLKPLATWFPDPREALRLHNAHHFVFAKDRESDDYGWAALPLGHIVNNWGFEVVAFNENLGHHQAVCLLRKPASF